MVDFNFYSVYKNRCYKFLLANLLELMKVDRRMQTDDEQFLELGDLGNLSEIEIQI